MDDGVFIKSNANKDLKSVTKINRVTTDLGTLKLITVCLAKDFMAYSNLCNANESPIYVKEINETRTPKAFSAVHPLSCYLTQNKISGLFGWNTNILDENSKHKLLDVYVNNIHNINLIKNSKSSMTINTKGPAKINDIELEGNKTYIIKFQLLDRSSNRGEEYFMHKTIIDKIPTKEDDMLESIKQHIK